MKRAPQADPAAALGGLLLCGCSHLVAGMSSSGVRSMGVGETVEAGGGLGGRLHSLQVAGL